MKRLPVLVLLLVVTLGLGACHSAAPQAAATPPRSELVILVSLDGFRWDYLTKYEAPTLRTLAAGGVHAVRMTSCFPSLTFPNHYSIVTGLRPEHHGIVANTFYAPELDEEFHYTNHECSIDPRWWTGGEPVWITAEKQGVRSACFFWPGSEAENHGLRPSLFKTFDKKLTCAQRVDGLLEWLGRPAGQRPRFATLYFDLVDTVGHHAGPDAPETAAAVREADAALAHLLDGLAALGLRARTDLVLVSDHGMEAISPDRTILIDDYVDPAAIKLDFAGPVAGLRPKTGTAAQLADRFRGRHPQLTVWLREEVPARLHFRASDHISPVLLCAAPGWTVTTRSYLEKKRATWSRGDHGWDPATPDMGALFIASGPSFRHGYEFADVENIHVYDLLCAVLGIRPAPNDGDDRLVRETLAR